MILQLKASNAYAVCEYFDRNADIYADFSLQFIDFDKVEIYFQEEGLSLRKKKERIEEIEDKIFTAHL